MTEMSIIWADVNPTDKMSIEKALYDLSWMDEDFNGGNGEECLWDNARALDFTSNQDYAVSMAMQKNGLFEIVSEFLKIWLWHNSWYNDYCYDFIRNKDKEITHIVLTVSYDI